MIRRNVTWKELKGNEVKKVPEMPINRITSIMFVVDTVSSP